MSVIWRKGRFRCELWASGSEDSYQLKLFRDHELVRLEDVALLIYTRLASSWKVEIESAGAPTS